MEAEIERMMREDEENLRNLKVLHDPCLVILFAFIFPKFTFRPNLSPKSRPWNKSN